MPELSAKKIAKREWHCLKKSRIFNKKNYTMAININIPT